MPNLNTNELLFSLPLDIWREISRYLEPHEIEKLKLVCKSLNRTLTDLQLDNLWMPFLNRLHAMDPSISVNVPAGKIRSAFITGMQKINHNQKSEIAHFQKQLDKLSSRLHQNDTLLSTPRTAPSMIASVKNKLLGITHIDAPPLKKLELIYQILNDLNVKLFEVAFQNLKLETLGLTSLNLAIFFNDSFFTLTRLPGSLFLHPDYGIFWQNVEEIDCDRQQIRFISKEIKICKNLRRFSICYNELESLPEEIAECKALELLSCDSNQLMSLPQRINELENLKALHCSYNKLQHLPDIPPSCSSLAIEGNYLQQIPKELQDRFGDKWAFSFQRTKTLFAPIFPETELPPSSPFIPTVLKNIWTMVSSLSGYLPSFSSAYISSNNNQNTINISEGKSEIDESDSDDDKPNPKIAKLS